MDNQLTLDRVTIAYDSASAVADVSFALPEGDIGCLLGPSGCGKTSLLRAIAGFEPLAAGAISLRGQTISTPQYAQAPEERAVGMVFQDFALFPHLSVSDNVGFGLAQGNADQRRARIAEMLELVGLANEIERYPHELSGGQQQRVALARALAPNPKILLLDEPFSNLDSVRRSQLAGEIRAMLKRSKQVLKTKTFSTCSRKSLVVADDWNYHGALDRKKLHQFNVSGNALGKVHT